MALVRMAVPQRRLACPHVLSADDTPDPVYIYVYTPAPVCMCVYAPAPVRSFAYSYRSATIGSSSAARRAGHMPKKMPTAAEKAKAMATAKGAMDTFQPAMFCTA
jgi:hypothetical protein